MKVGRTHLTYCTNIHPGESWSRVFSNLRTHLLEVRDLVSVDQPFGVGLRLSAEAADTLVQPEPLAEFRSFLEQERLYVFTLNGFPYGPFHGQAVKATVYQPDWTDPERARYTGVLTRVLSQLLPEGMTGSISTVPGGFKRDITSPARLATIARQLHEQVAELHALEREQGRRIVLALEPEPCCLLETSDETVAFFEEHLLSRTATRELQTSLGVSAEKAEQLVRRHLGVCLDTCHAAVEFEEPAETLATLGRAGLCIAKVQASAGLRLPDVSEASLAELASYDEPVYLHQVVSRSADGTLSRYEDLPQAFASATAKSAREWRVHFHVPLYREQLGAFFNTQGYLNDLLAALSASPVTEQIEVETYTWSVLPEAQRAPGLEHSIARELAWVKERLPA